MKRLFTNIFICLITLTSLISCSNAQEECTQIADSFIKAYFTNNYDDAIQYCDTELAEHLQAIKVSFEKLDKALAGKLSEMGAGVECKVSEVSFDENDKDLCHVKFEISEKTYLSPTTKALEIRKIDNAWKISKVEE